MVLAFLLFNELKIPLISPNLPFDALVKRIGGSLFGGILRSIQLQPHQHELLPARKAGAEAARVAAVFHKADALVQRDGGGVVRHHA